MTFAITLLKNASDRSAISYNLENVDNSFYVPPFKARNDLNQWISQHEDKPLILSTRKGFCHLWDQDFQIFGRWEGEEVKTSYIKGNGGDVAVVVNDKGEITIQKT